MNENLTEKEISTLEAAKSEVEWNAACDAIKRARAGQYPSDWFAKVLASGLAGRVAATWGGNTDIRISSF